MKEFVKVNKAKRSRQGRNKASAANTSVDLSIQTDYDNDKEEVRHADHETFSIVRLDRGAQGSSSSSADNNDPSTPSPLSVTAMPVVVESTGGVDNELGSEADSLDPHLARLLAGLSSSASRSSSKEDSQSTATIDTVVNRAESDPNLNSIPESTMPVKQVKKGDPTISATQSSNPTSPTSLSSVTPHQADQLSASSSSHTVIANRHLKHLALLESVANESNTLSSGPPGVPMHLPHNIPPLPGHPLPSSPAFPARFDTRSIPPHPSGNLGPPPPMRGIGGSSFRNQPFVPASNDPFTVRPMTSHASHPLTLSPRRHGPNMSMHQDQLLNILGGPIGPVAPARFPPPQFSLSHMMNGAQVRQGPMYAPRPNGISPQIQAHAPAPQPLRVVPPPLGVFPNNPGPLTAPMVANNTNPTIHLKGTSAPTPERVHHLLSLFQSSNTATPTSILTAGATGPNYPSGSSAVNVSSHSSHYAVSNNTSHR